MNSILKLDGRTLRGRKWKEYNAAGKPLKQGVLMEKKVCSKCNEAPDFEIDVIECMSCHFHFHVPCLVKSLSEEFLETVKTDPSIWWFCAGCISCKSGESSLNADGNSTPELLPNDVVLQSTLLNFKKEMLTVVGETIETKLRAFADLNNTVCKSNVISNCNENTLINSATHRSYASISAG